MDYDFRRLEAKWQDFWAKDKTFKASNDSTRPKYYALSMFPYPSGAGLHVGHPLGYIATDIYARYKRHKGFNVLHPMGYDSFGLPAEQYAIQTGQHPALTTERNIARYREQLDRLGFSFDWDREVRTSDPAYYKWTQWIFVQLFESWYDRKTQRAEPIDTLVALFEAGGNVGVDAACDADVPSFTAQEWKGFSKRDKERLLLKYRLAYLADSEVNWCPALGTVLANDEIVNGLSERGGHPVIRKKMTQWSLRITAYAQRLLDGLDDVDWPQPLKDAQTNWIGRSQGASVRFRVLSEKGVAQPEYLEVFTTRPDTIFGASFMCLAPEHPLVEKLTVQDHKAQVQAYVEATAKRSERDRMADVKTITGVFTGAYAEHPFTREPLPIWIGDYVLAGYGTGAVMAVPCGDQRDHDFARHFGLPIPNIFKGVDTSKEAFSDKATAVIANSGFLSGLPQGKAAQRAIQELVALGQGHERINFRLRDAVFSRQRYWGEPFPVYYVEGMPQMIPLEHLPLRLPEVEKYLPTETGDPPLGNATRWAWDSRKNTVVSNGAIDHQTVFPLELNTMPGWAGSSQYFNRYMDPKNDGEIFSQEAVGYWQDVDLYIGGSEHATGHLLYARFWQMFMYDRGHVPQAEFARKLINQGMITGTSAFVHRLSFRSSEGDPLPALAGLPQIFIGLELKKGLEAGTQAELLETHRQLQQRLIEKYNLDRGAFQGAVTTVLPIHADVSLVNASDELDIEAFKAWQPEFRDADFLLEDGRYLVGREVEKMSKSKYNVVNPDAICQEYGADSLRLYEMFLGPLEQSKPWNTAGISGVHSFLKKLWRLYDRLDDGEPTPENLRTLHRTIKKTEEDIEQFSFNTTVSTFMICVNELTAQKCGSRAILEPLAILVSPYAPHLAEELWERLGHAPSIATAPFPVLEPRYLEESSKEYPISFNGKTRFTLALATDLDKEAIEAAVLAHEKTKAQLQGRSPKKVIVVPGKIVNIVG